MPGQRSGVRYRPHLDGLRAVAVYLVIAFHAGLGDVDSGFIGVDVFFVLSGFLVTKLLLVDLVRRGRPDARRFYARRSRRILPAAILVLVIAALAYRIMAPPADVLDAMGGFRAASVYVANWFFINQSTDYFASGLAQSPVLHFWSLAVEEQFYLLWPLLLGGCYLAVKRLGAARWVVLRVIIGSLAVASAVAAVRIGNTDLARAYYGTDTRAYQLLMGALVALSPSLGRLQGRARATVAATAAPAIAAIFLLATPLVGVGPISRGLMVTGTTVLLIVALENARSGPVAKLLASSPMTALGRVSYGTYLWHWPIIVLLALEIELIPAVNFMLAAIGATLLAAASYAVMERPIRSTPRLDGRAIPVVVTGLACSMLVGLLLMPRILDAGNTRIAGASVRGPLVDWKDAESDFARRSPCLDGPVTACTVVRGRGPHVLLLGDSVGQMWIPPMVELARRFDFTLSLAVRGGCSWMRGLNFVGIPTRDECVTEREDWYERVIPTLDPDVVVLAMNDPYGDMDFPDGYSILLGNGRVIPRASDEFQPFLETRFAASLVQLGRASRQFVILEPLADPPARRDPLRCLSSGRSPTECAYRARPEATPLEMIFRSRDARDPNVISADLDAVVCPQLPRCDSVRNGIIVWKDGVHLTATYARSLAAQLAETLGASGVEFVARRPS